MNILRTGALVIVYAMVIFSGGLALAAMAAWCRELLRERRERRDLPTNRTSTDLWAEFTRVDQRAFHPSSWDA